MRVDPTIAALRGDPLPQRRAQATMVAARDAWRNEACVAPVLADFERYGRGAPLADCPEFARLFAAGNAARQFADCFCALFSATLAGEPLGQLPFRHAFDGALSTLLLARAGTAQLTLTAQEPGEHDARSVVFSDAVRRDAVITGEAKCRVTCMTPEGSLAHTELRLAPGFRVELDPSREALFVSRVEQRLVTLRLHRSAPQPSPVREHSLADGSLVHQAQGAIRHSRQEMMLALLGRMKRGEAAPLMAAMAGEEGPDSLRWQALREALALDTAEGFAALCRLARSPLDPLAAPAGAQHAQLVEAHPQLLAFEEAQCHA